jgi:hypothetical protein
MSRMPPPRSFPELPILHADALERASGGAPTGRIDVTDGSDGSRVFHRYDDSGALTHHFRTWDNGAVVNYSPTTGNVSGYTGPTYYGNDGLRSLEDVTQNQHWWNQYREENGLNRVGPDGREPYLPWNMIPGGQQFADGHDVQARQAHWAVERDATPLELPPPGPDERVTYETARDGYVRTLLYGPDDALRWSQEEYRRAGFDVDGPMQREEPPGDFPPDEMPPADPPE